MKFVGADRSSGEATGVGRAGRGDLLRARYYVNAPTETAQPARDWHGKSLNRLGNLGGGMIGVPAFVNRSSEI